MPAVQVPDTATNTADRTITTTAPGLLKDGG
jgi:hypothetical protein